MSSNEKTIAELENEIKHFEVLIEQKRDEYYAEIDRREAELYEFMNKQDSMFDGMEHDLDNLQNSLQDLRNAEPHNDPSHPVHPKILAEFLHSNLCSANHIDGCSWTYSSWASPCSARLAYLKKAEEALKVAEYDTIVKVLKAI